MTEPRRRTIAANLTRGDQIESLLEGSFLVWRITSVDEIAPDRWAIWAKRSWWRRSRRLMVVPGNTPLWLVPHPADGDRGYYGWSSRG